MSSVSIILYHESFEVLNPLGSGTKKAQATYCLHVPVRNLSIDPIQLAMLCKEEDLKFLGLEKVFVPLAGVLMGLEEAGVELHNGQKLQDAVLTIVQGNFGSHN